MARDIWFEYVDDAVNTCSFPAFLSERLQRHRVVDLKPLRGAARRAARTRNEAYVLGQRAEMRSRLVHAAIDGVLVWDSAHYV